MCDYFSHSRPNIYPKIPGGHASPTSSHFIIRHTKNQWFFIPSARWDECYFVSKKISFAMLCFVRLLIELGTVDVSFRLNHSTHSNCRLGPLPPQHYHHHHHHSSNVNLICDNDQHNELIIGFLVNDRFQFLSTMPQSLKSRSLNNIDCDRHSHLPLLTEGVKTRFLGQRH